MYKVREYLKYALCITLYILVSLAFVYGARALMETSFPEIFLGVLIGVFIISRFYLWYGEWHDSRTKWRDYD